MDIIERKFPAQDIRVFVNLLKWDNNEMLLLGTGSSATQLYPSDIDLFSKIFNTYSSDAVYKKVIEKLTEASQRPDMFFIEGKIQDKDGEKFKWKNMAELKRPASVVKFKSLYDKNIDYVKFDFVLYLNQQFVELSVIYVFNKDDLDYSALKMSLSNDMIDLIHEKKYYKSLKRLFALLKLEHPPARNNLIKISELFNSSIGALYKRNSILKAVELFLETYQDPQSIRLAKRVYENLGFTNLTEMPKIIKAYDAVINREGKKFIMRMYPQLLKIKKSNKPIMVEGGKRVYRSAIVHADIMKGGKTPEEIQKEREEHFYKLNMDKANAQMAEQFNTQRDRDAWEIRNALLNETGRHQKTDEEEYEEQLKYDLMNQPREEQELARERERQPAPRPTRQVLIWGNVPRRAVENEMNRLGINMDNLDSHQDDDNLSTIVQTPHFIFTDGGVMYSINFNGMDEEQYRDLRSFLNRNEIVEWPSDESSGSGRKKKLPRKGGADKSAKSALGEEALARKLANLGVTSLNPTYALPERGDPRPVLQASQTSSDFRPLLPPENPSPFSRSNAVRGRPATGARPDNVYEDSEQFVRPVNMEGTHGNSNYVVMTEPATGARPDVTPPRRKATDPLPPPPKNGKGKKTSPWVEHCKKYAAKHGVSYKQAMKDARASYKRKGAGNDDFSLNLPPYVAKTTPAPIDYLKYMI